MRDDLLPRIARLDAPGAPLLQRSRRTETAFPNGARARYTYNVDNTLAQVLTQAGSSVVSQHDYTYDGVGNRQTHTEQIGAVTTPYKYVYDSLDRLLEVGTTPPMPCSKVPPTIPWATA